MILLRLREPGDDDWTEVRLDGELEGDLQGLVEDVLSTARWRVERQDEDGAWESVNE